MMSAQYPSTSHAHATEMLSKETQQNEEEPYRHGKRKHLEGEGGVTKTFGRGGECHNFQSMQRISTQVRTNEFLVACKRLVEEVHSLRVHTLAHCTGNIYNYKHCLNNNNVLFYVLFFQIGAHSSS